MKPVILLNGLMAVSTLGVSYILLSHVGITAVGIAWLASQTVVAAIVFPRLLRMD
jgi:hypothetical protein